MAHRNWRLALGAVLILGGVAAGTWAYMSRPGGDPKPAPPPGAAVRPVAGPAWFRDVTNGSGVNFIHRNGEDARQFTILESLGGGCALFDYDGDGLLDLFVTGGGFFDGPDKTAIQGLPCKLYRNLGNLKFQDVTKECGLDIAWWYNHGAAVADYDRDGWPDLLVTGYGRIALFHNESDSKGGRRFVDVSHPPSPPLRKGGQGGVGLVDDSWSTSAGWGDIDGDGYPDLYVCHYVDWSFANHPVCEGHVEGVKRDVCPPQKFKPLVHALFHNDQGKAFRNVASQQGFQAAGCGLGVVLADLNQDGRPDIYVGNDGSNNFLFFNRGGKLEEKGLMSGTAVDDEGHYDGSMGVDVGDFDGSGRASVWVTNYQGDVHALYQNLGKELFHFQSRAAGIAALGQQSVGFGTGFIDVDNDGWEDLVIANGHVLQHPILGSTHKQTPVLLRNIDFQGRRFFKDIGAQGGPFFQSPTIGRGLAIGDLDNDGWPDLVISHTNSPVAILRNETAAATAKPARWLGLRLVGREHRDIVGSTVMVECGSRKFTRFVKGGGSYLSASDPRILVGMGDGDSSLPSLANGGSGGVRVTVKWSWGKTESWDNLEIGRYVELKEGTGK